MSKENNALANALAALAKANKTSVESAAHWAESAAQIASLTNQGQVTGFVILTQAQYDALATKDPKIVYLIRG